MKNVFRLLALDVIYVVTELLLLLKQVITEVLLETLNVIINSIYN